MTPRSKRYFARRKYGESLFAKLIPIFESIQLAKDAYMRLTTPIPKYPPGTSHPGGWAIVGDSLPELMIHRSRVEMAGPPVIRPLPSSCVIPHGLIDPRMLQIPVADLKRAVNEHLASDLVKKAVKDAYTRLPDFARGNITIADK